MKKKTYIIANWKMNMDFNSAARFFDSFKGGSYSPETEVVICPSFPLIDIVGKYASGKGILVGGQNIFWEEKGAFTGEVSARQLKESGCDYVIIGHSERREIFGETDEIINKKIKIARKNKLTPIVCLGESYEEKEAALTKKVIEKKLRGALLGVSLYDARKIIIAYEPIWAISSNPRNIDSRPDTPEEVQVIHRYIKKILEDIYDEHVAGAISVVYGGSVNPDDVSQFAAMDDIGGVLVGRASQEAEKFEKIIRAFII